MQQNSPQRLKKEIEDEKKSPSSDDLFKTPPQHVSDEDEPKKSGPKKSGSSDEPTEEQVAKPAMLSQET